MTYTEISVPDMNDSFSRIVISDTVYHLRFTWNDYGQYWMFGLFTDLKEPIVQGVKLVPNFVLNYQVVDSRMPVGIFAVKTDMQRIGRESFANGDAAFIFASIA